ncbi:hypothetical protein LCGC14_0853290 [marine sediment metagenome]|uniref:Uncharacterized protein n=1 Tax=marine sediment metagenome TaxID=412755 RepID=A0A0F9PUV0_9ZZZZ
MPEFGNLARGWTLGDGFTLAQWMLLGQEVGRLDPFFRQTRSSRRKPVFSVFVEGRGSVTLGVKNATWNRRIKDSLHEPQHGSGSVTLVDSDGTLIRNGRSVIQVGDKVKIWAGFARSGFIDGDLVPRFAGVVQDPEVNTITGEITLALQDYGFLMKNAQTSGDFSAFNTPKLLVDELVNRLNLKAPTWENESGLPSTFELGFTDPLSRRSYWAIIHGALLGIGYIYFFDGSGDLQCKRRDNSFESNELFTDSDIGWIRHKEMAELINEKSVALGVAAPVPWSATAGDSIRWGQSNYTPEDQQSQAQFGLASDFESEEMLTTWDNILPFARDSVKALKFPRQIYNMSCPARPYLDIHDTIRVDSDRRNIHGQMKIIELTGAVSAASYSQRLTLLSERELF